MSPLAQDSIRFNGLDSDDSSLGIVYWREWNRPILPETRDQLLEIAGKDGAHDFGRDLSPIEISGTFVLAGATVEALRGYVRAVAAWLDRDTVGPLIFGDEDDIQYMARRIGLSSMQQIVTTGEGQVTFLVPEGLARSVAFKDFVAFPSTNAGTAPCPVVITATMTGPDTSLRITLAGTGEFVQIDQALALNEVVVIDTEHHLVTVETVDARANVTFTSDYFYIPPGAFTLNVTGAATISARIVERWK